MNKIENMRMVEALEGYVRENIIIPPSLAGNFAWTTTGIGGAFLSYYSNSKGGAATLNSRVFIKMDIGCSDNGGRYIGDVITVETMGYRGIKPMRAKLTPIPVDKGIEYINKWIEKNAEFLLVSIEA